MRNLKRVLSLALASVMLLGMMVIGAGAADKTAADLTDMDQVTNKEAVSLMVDLGIIVGKPDGSYAPTEGVDRATMAKLITYVLMGDVDASIFEGTKTDLTDIDTNWAEGYIKYCYSNGIITGDGQGHFFPTQGVTVVQAAKMLLVALGYEAEDRGYQNNSSWSVNIMKDAQTAGLMTNINAKATDTLTRDGAAQMIFNALFANTVTPKYAYDMGVQYVTEYTKGATLGYQSYGLVKKTTMVTGIDANGNATLFDSSVGNVTVTGKLPATADMVGSTVNLYLKGTLDSTGAITAASKLYSSALVTANNNVVASVNGLPQSNALGGNTGNAALTALLVTTSSKVASLEAGKTINNLVLYYNGQQDAAKTNLAKIGKLGVQVDFKDTNTTAGVDTVVITEKTVAKLSADPTVTTKDDKTTVTIGSLGIANMDASKVKGYEGLVKGDVVLYVNLGGTYYIEKAEKVTGPVSGNNTTKGALINGTYYQASELGGKTYVNAAITDTATYDFYLDNGGYIVAAEKVTEGTATTSLAVVDQVAWVKPNTDGSLESNAKPYMQAKLVFTDGTTKIVTVASVDGVVPVAVGSDLANGLYYNNSGNAATTSSSKAVAKLFYYTAKDTAVTAKYFGVDATGDLTSNKAKTLTNTTTAGSDSAFITENQFYNYSVNSKGEYVLTSLKTEQGANTAIKDTKITNNTANFATGFVGNANTVFIYAAKDSSGTYTYTVYTGIANVPTTASNVTGYAIVKDAVSSYVFVDLGTTGTVTGSSDLVYIVSGNYTSVTGETAYIYDVLLNGKATTLKLAASTYSAGDLYAVKSISDKDVYTLDTTNLSDSAKTGIKSVAGSVLVLANGGAGEVFSYESGAAAYVVDGKNVTTTTIDALELDGNDKVSVITVAGNTSMADVVYVTKVSQEPTTVTLGQGSTNQPTVSASDLKAGTGAVTGYVAGSADKVKVDVTATPNTTLETISINGTVVASGADYTLTGAGTYSVVVTVKDNNSGALSTFSYSFTVAA